MKAEEAIKEFARKYGGTIITGYGQQYGSGSVEFSTAEEECISDLNSLISEHYYPKEFVLWLVIQDYWGMDILTCKWTNDEPTAFQEEKTTDELYEYWKENER